MNKLKHCLIVLVICIAVLTVTLLVGHFTIISDSPEDMPTQIWEIIDIQNKGTEQESWTLEPYRKER